MRRVGPMVLVALLLAVAPRVANAQDCSRLPSSAQRARSCNPQRECLAQVERSLKGPALESGRRDCQRLPTNGTCYGPETYNPQAECLASQGRRR